MPDYIPLDGIRSPPGTPSARMRQGESSHEKDRFGHGNIPQLNDLRDFDAVQERHYTELNDEKRRDLRKEFHPKKQLRKLLVGGLFRWLITAILIACLYGTLCSYSNKPVISKAKKRQFNALITGLSIALGLSIASSLKAIAIEMRWWILSRRQRSLYEVDLILKSESISHVLKLATVAPRANVILTVLAWILLNIAAQIAVATLGLTYSVDDANSSALTVAGNVSIPDMSVIGTNKIVSSQSQADGAVQYTANSFGTIALAYISAPIEAAPPPRSLWGLDNPPLFYGDDYYEFIFSDSSSDPTVSNPVTVATNRSINATGTCNSWPVVEGGDGTTLNFTILLDSDGTRSQKSFPIAGGESQSTFVTRASQNCGTGCSTISALEASADTPWYYECNVTVGNVNNATRAEHEVSDSLRDLASAAIALQGYAVSSMVNNSDIQYQTYPAESLYGAPQNGSTGGMGLLMSRFTIGVIGAAAQNNPYVTISGDRPVIGVVLNVNEWKYVHVILGLTGAVQFILFIISAFLANRVVVKDDSHLAIARMLRPMTDSLGPSGSIATGGDICDAFGDSRKFIYSIRRTSEGGVYHLDLGQEKLVRTFPKGIYL